MSGETISLPPVPEAGPCPPAVVEALDLKGAVHVGHSTEGGGQNEQHNGDG